MNLSTCPLCDEPIRLPELQLPEETQAECPWCLERFSLAAISKQLPPLVELFDDAGMPVQSMATVGAIDGNNFAGAPPEDSHPIDAATLPFDAEEEIEVAASVDDDLTGDEESMQMGDPSAETWTEDDASPEHPFSPSDETVVFDTEVEDSKRIETLDVEPLDVETLDEDELESEFDEVGPDDIELQQDPSETHDFRIEESGPISENDYEIVAEENTVIDTAELHGGLAPMRVKSSSRRKPKKSNLRTLIGIALGPILAVPIAGIIFYLLGTDLGFWPLDGGRSSRPNVSASPPMDISHFDTEPNAEPAAVDRADLYEGSASDAPADDVPLDDAPAESAPERATDKSFATSTALRGKEEKAIGQDSGMDQSFWVPDELSESLASDVNSEEPLSIGGVPWDEADETAASLDTSELTGEALPEELQFAEGTTKQSNSQPVPDATVAMSSVSEGSLFSSPAVETLPKKDKPRRDAVVTRKRAQSELEPQAEFQTEPQRQAESEPDKKTIHVDTKLITAIADARKQLKRLEGLSDAPKSSKKYKDSLAWTYAKLADVGAISDDSAVDQVISLVEELKQSPRLNDFAAATPIWLRATNRTSNGTILIGRPGSNSNGPTITLPSGLEISVVTHSVTMPRGNKVVALGRIEQESPVVVVRLVAADTAN